VNHTLHFTNDRLGTLLRDAQNPRRIERRCRPAVVDSDRLPHTVIIRRANLCHSESGGKPGEEPAVSRRHNRQGHGLNARARSSLSLLHQSKPIAKSELKAQHLVFGKGAAMCDGTAKRVKASHNLFNRFLTAKQPPEHIPVRCDDHP